MILKIFCFFHSKIIDGVAKFCGFFVKNIVLVVNNIISIGIFLNDAAIIGLVDIVTWIIFLYVVIIGGVVVWVIVIAFIIILIVTITMVIVTGIIIMIRVIVVNTTIVVAVAVNVQFIIIDLITILL